MAPAPRTRVFFRWACTKVKLTEEVRAVGDCLELGQWDPSQGLLLSPSEEAEDCFCSRGVLLPLGQLVQYKYVIFERSASEISAIRWDTGDGNRSLVPTGFRQIVEDDDGRCREASLNFPVLQVPHIKSKNGGQKDANQKAVLSRGTSKSRLEEQFQKLTDAEANLTSNDEVLVAFRMLPFRVVRSTEKSSTSGWHVVENMAEKNPFTVASLMSQELRDERPNFKIKFVGDPGVRTNDPKDKQQITEALAPFSCVPVFIDELVVEKHRDFCFGFLWPIMHNVKVFESDDEKFDEAEWRAFQSFNRSYAEVLEANSTSKTLMWVHDYYLMMVPKHLRARCPEAAISYFQHCSFPSLEVLRCMPNREEILLSMLSCKVVTFQVFAYARHFLSCCQYVFGTTHSFQAGGVLTVDHDGRNIVVRADHMVLPFARFLKRMESPLVLEKAKSIRAEFGSRKIFGSIDGDEPFAGLILKFRAFQQFLTDCPQHRQSVALLQHVLVDDAKAEQSELVRELRKMAEDLNRSFSGPKQPPVVKICLGALSADDRLAVLRAADVLLDTSINEGLNLHPFMFYVAHSQDQKGMTIVSEFTGSSMVLTGALKVNPWHSAAVVDVMHKAIIAITEDEKEQSSRFAKDHSYVSTQTLFTWMSENLSELKKVQYSAACRLSSSTGLHMQTTTTMTMQLNIDAVVRDYKQAKVRAIFLDNEGTLAPDQRHFCLHYTEAGLGKSVRRLAPEVLETLAVLSSDRRNSVVVISGRDQNTMQDLFSQVDGLGLCAEYGFHYVQPKPLKAKESRSESETPWCCSLGDNTNEGVEEWRILVLELMQLYVKRVQGSIVENKGSAIAWNYREVGAQNLAKEIARELFLFLDPNGPDGLLRGYPVTVVAGKGYVEVRRLDVDKGVAVSRVLSDMQQLLGCVDFVLCIGDDRSDEDMFSVINSMSRMSEEDLNQCDASTEADTASDVPSIFGMTRERKAKTVEIHEEQQLQQRTRFYSVTVGRKATKAKHFLKDVGEVSEVLRRLADVSAQERRFSRVSSAPMLKGKVQHQPMASSDEEDQD